MGKAALGGGCGIDLLTLTKFLLVCIHFQIIQESGLKDEKEVEISAFGIFQIQIPWQFDSVESSE